MKNFFACLLFAAFTTDAVFADATETVAGPACKKPVAPSALRKADDTSEFDDKFETYKSCVQDYAADQQKVAQKHVDAANAAINDLNAYIVQINEQHKQ